MKFTVKWITEMRRESFHQNLLCQKVVHIKVCLLDWSLYRKVVCCVVLAVARCVWCSRRLCEDVGIVVLQLLCILAVGRTTAGLGIVLNGATVWENWNNW